MANSDPSPLTLYELAGPARLELYFRALPYRPLRIGGRQRAEFTWYPGSAAAVVQMLGPEEEPITMNGFWKDRFIGAITGTQQGQALFNGEPVYSAVELVAIVDSLRRSGKKFRLQWDKLVRFGHITSFVQTWHTPHDCEWELEFSVTAQEEAADAVVKADPVSVVEASYTLQAQAQDLPTENPLVAASNRLRAATFAVQTAINNTVGQVAGTATSLASAVLSPFAAGRALASTLAQSVISVSATGNTISNQAIAEFFAFTGGQNNAPIGQQAAGYSYQNQWRTATNAFRRSSAFLRYETERQMQAELIASFTAEQEMDFRDVSIMFYGTQDGWRDLMLRNGYPTSRLAAGDLVWVPARASIAGEAGSAGDAGRPTASW